MNSTFEIDVEEIMKDVRNNIHKVKETGVNPENETGILQKNDSITEFDSTIHNNLDYINSTINIHNNGYIISSHRPILGKILVKGRELVHDETKRYVDPMFQKQTGFNENIVRIIKNFIAKLNSFNDKIEQLKPEIDDKIEQLKPEIDDKIEQLKPEIDDKIKTQINSLISSINMDIEKKAWLVNILNKKIKSADLQIKSSESKALDLNYVEFEDKFRGPREEVRRRQVEYLDYFQDCSNVLDIGCGRGEFLELLKKNEINASGIDINDNMVDFCQSKGLDVEKEDAIKYLEQLEDKCLDGIFISQIVEHLEPDYLIKLLKLCSQKLNDGYYLIVETVNPLSFVSSANFYLDLTHKKPLHPETLKFLFESYDFRNIESTFLSPVPEDARLKSFSTYEGMNDKEKMFVETYNQNMNLLNNILFGAQDYAIIGIK